MEQPSAENDGAEGKPGPAESESADDVRQPVKVEQHAASRDADRYRDRRCGGEGSCASRQIPPDDQGDGRPERGGGRGMPAGKGRPECGGGGVERGAEAADEIFDAELGKLRPCENDEQEQPAPAAALAEHVEEHDEHRKAGDDRAAAELGDGVQSARGRARAVVIAPRGCGVVDVLDERDVPHEQREHAEHESADEGHGEGEREQKPACDLAIRPPGEESSQAAMRLDGLADRARGVFGRMRGCRRRACVPLRGEISQEPGEERCGEVDGEWHEWVIRAVVRRGRVSELPNQETLGRPLFPPQEASNLSVQTVPTNADVVPGRAYRRSSALDFEVLDKEPGPFGRLLAALAGERRPVVTFVYGLALAFVAIASMSIVAGLVVTHVLLHVPGVANDDGSLVRFLVHHRSAGLTEASLVGSIMAGGVVLPIIAVAALIVGAVFRHWRLACFLAFALLLEVASYRTTTLVVHRPRPYVPRLEKLPADASYPSGHTAASIAIYWGIALLLTSRIESRAAQVSIWVVAGLIPVFVAFSRMYRGMHHPIDAAGGLIVGIAALCAVVGIERAVGKACR